MSHYFSIAMMQLNGAVLYHIYYTLAAPFHYDCLTLPVRSRIDAHAPYTYIYYNIIVAHL